MKRAILLLVVFALLAALVLAVMPAQAQGEFDSSSFCCTRKFIRTNECMELACIGSDVMEWWTFIDPVSGVRYLHFECRQSPASVNGR